MKGWSSPACTAGIPKRSAPCWTTIGLKGMSAHVPLDELLADIDKVVEDYKTLGCRYIAVPWLDEARRPGQPGYPQVLADIRAHRGGLRLQGHDPAVSQPRF